MHVGRKDGGDKVANILPESTFKKMYDHRPHAVRLLQYLISIFAILIHSNYFRYFFISIDYESRFGLSCTISCNLLL